MSNGSSPISKSERVFEIDAVRGFALLGILMMNIMSFAGPTLEEQFTMEQSDIYTGQWNELSLYFINTFATSNFYTMFSFLFGLGFYIFLSRAEKRQNNVPYLLFLKRMLILLVIGLMHAVLIWYGDILTVYAAAGVLLLVFYRFKPVVNLAAAAAILGVSTIFILLLSMMSLLFSNSSAGSPGGFDPGFNMTEVLTGGSYADIVNLNLSVFSIMISSNITIIPLVLAMFLIGLYVGQKGIFQNLDAHKKLISRTAIIGLGAGIPIKLVLGYGLTYMMDDMMWQVLTLLAYSAGGPLMSLGYVALFIIIAKKVTGLTKLLQPVGQMALTNYIMQSILMTVVIYGFNIFNTIEAVWFIPVVVVVFTVQVIYSHIWMKFFRFGPLEWIWRSLTYSKTMPIKRIEHR
ncbi:DUF418 domain-containing protein [Salinicoccus albus]|uniref:DUF418 domain-containing protein n=1 Tax=Salinicoccus albus TaxID=418756 RepID=UPI00037E02F1|nr:DUF418 domain-containing protein [Salinicoccus albus]